MINKLRLRVRADKAAVAVGDEISVYVRAWNTGNHDLRGVLISCVPSRGIVFVRGSVVLSGDGQPSASPVSGLFFPKIWAGAKIGFSFRVKAIMLPEDQCAYLQALAVSTDKRREREPPFAVSGTLGVPVLQARLSMKKNVTPDGRRYLVEVILSNDGNTSACGVVFRDALPEGCYMLSDSFTAGGETICRPELSSGVCLPDIKPGEELIIRYLAERREGTA